MAGLATATIVPSSATIITPRATASSVRAGLPRIRRGPLAACGLAGCDLAVRATAVPVIATLTVAGFVSIASSLSRLRAVPAVSCQIKTSVGH